MANGELAAKAAAESSARTKQADDDALLAAEAYAFGVWDKYVQAKVTDIERRINDRFGTTGTTDSTVQPPDLGKPVA